AAADTLVEALWDSDLPAAPRNAVQHHVTRLRRALGPEAIRLAPDGYALDGATVDAFEFEELLAAARTALRAGDPRSAAETIESALTLWRGPPLLGVPDSAWTRAEAGRLEAMRVDALEERFEAALALGEHAEVARAVRAALEENAFRERMWGQLMLALYRSGRQAEALETFQEARRVLSEELALEPGPELRRLQQAILAQDPAIAPVPAPPTRRGNLPAPVTSFVGREQELAEVLQLVREHRLVTLTGPPGVGKSRLALEAMRVLETEVRDGVWLVDLSRARDAADVPRVVGQTLEPDGPAGAGDPLDHALARLHDVDPQTIVVLDNCARVIDEARRVASAVAEAAPHVRVVATSRQVLGLGGEAQLRLAPLAVPGPDAYGVAELAGFDAIRLFEQRARDGLATFALGADNAAVVADICRRLDGLPLAIELAAARVNVFGLPELLSVLERRFALLLDADERPTDASQALAALVAWSYDLLHADEKKLLQQLAVHRGGASLRALVAGVAEHELDEATVIYLLGALVDKSIVTVSFPTGDARYDMLITVRDYTLERLEETGGLERAQRAHAEYFAAFAEQAHGELRGPDWQACVSRLELEHDNLWSALAYAREFAAGDLAVRLAGPLGWYFALAERVSEGRHFLERALAVTKDAGPVRLRSELLAWLCFFATEEVDLERALELGERALALAASPSAPAPLEAGLAKVTLSLACAHSEDHGRAADLVDEALADFRSERDTWGMALSALVRAGVAAGAGDVETVAAMTEEGRRYAEQMRYDALQPPSVLFEAWVAEQRGDLPAAEEAYRRAFDVSTRAGFRDHASFALTGLASVARARGDLPASEALSRRALGTALYDPVGWLVAHARAQLARVLAAGGDAETAEKLYRSVAEWSERRRRRRARETLFLALAGSPGAAALAGLAELADARGEPAVADELRAQATIRARLDGAPPPQRVGEEPVPRSALRLVQKWQ
ncbi:MAG TPA: BTAD domain-containing putative transcriptional regulator, partial [Gaiellaceae bacterium]|nr:BTAD domain-containing putative transcriptional regulator [Gaiellaceae bacterium]